MDNMKRKDKGTFIVKVEYCQHGSWQGKVVWAEENRSIRFRSALELIKIMDSAMNPQTAIIADINHSVS
ncbi:MAG: hypothetical protein K6G10_00650 [Butyrivibrio sp.]|nr:hypothetical protein [Butyrivibrio sp.]